MEFIHVSIMPEQCMDGLNIKPDGIYVDATTGGAGHSYRIASRLQGGRLICIDRDQDALDTAKQRLSQFGDTVTFVKSEFQNVKQVLQELNIPAIDGILFDLGVSSYQLDNPERGFSYMQDAPLDMRMDRAQSFTAWNVINEYPEQELKRILWTYGEERYSGRIAAAICKAREKAPLETTSQLVDVIRGAMPAPALREKQHPAKRSFQAIRIEVNQELVQVETAMRDSIDCLAPGGRIAVMSFHSLEDRLVKEAFKEAATGCTCPKSFPVCVCGKKPRVKLITRKPVMADEQELEDNPRSRSAKLRVAEKI